MLANNTLRWNHLAESCALLPFPFSLKEIWLKKDINASPKFVAIIQKMAIDVGIENESTKGVSNDTFLVRRIVQRQLISSEPTWFNDVLCVD
jgi:hypothetical protein